MALELYRIALFMTSSDNSPVLQLDGISKVYRRKGVLTKAVRSISLTVQPGEVFGFLGPNGAGKSTTIRMALGLIAPTTGTVRVFGEDISVSRNPLRRVGSLADGGSFFPHLSGRDNLRVLARTMGISDGRIDDLIALVDLQRGATRRVSEYSLGMKQRLGVAAALLNDPDLVILDEPTNGLDAAGIRDMRRLIRSLADEGKSVFLCSHLLNEVQQVCDRVAIVARGQVIQEASVAQLLETRERLVLVADPAEKAIEVLCGRWHMEKADGTILVTAARPNAAEIVRLLVENDVSVFEISVERSDLEAVFLHMTEAADA